MGAIARARETSAASGAGIRTRARSLWPREHGAYAQLGLPLVAAMAAGHVGPAAWLLALAAVALFLAHEPLLVCLGRRGARARGEAGPRARRRLALLAAISIALGAVGLVFAPPEATRVSLIPLLAGVGVALLAAKHREKTMAGEIVAAVALSGAALPVALASGWRGASASAAFVGWAVGFSAVTLAVWPIAHKRPLGWTGRLAAVLIPAGGGTAGAIILGPAAAAAALPLIAAAAAVAALRPAPRRLHQVGWAIAAAGAMATVAIVALAGVPSC